jgi:hypothetical protein
MAKKMVKEQWMLGDNPNPSKYEDVHTRDGWYRREKPNRENINSLLRRNADNTKITAYLGQQFFNKLSPWTKRLDLGRTQVNVTTSWRSQLYNNKPITLEFFRGLDLQPHHPLYILLDTSPQCLLSSHTAEVTVPLYWGALNKLNMEVTTYFFELIIIWGDPAHPETLRTDSVESPLYSYDSKATEDCKMQISLPPEGNQWVLFFKVSSFEGNTPAHNPRHYGMTVLRVNCTPIENSEPPKPPRHTPKKRNRKRHNESA